MSPTTSRRGGVAALLSLALLLPAGAQAAGAGTDALLKDCQDGTVDGGYDAGTFASALARLPTDADQYTNCRAVIRAAQLRAAATPVAPKRASTRSASRGPSPATPGDASAGGVPGTSGAPGASPSSPSVAPSAPVAAPAPAAAASPSPATTAAAPTSAAEASAAGTPAAVPAPAPATPAPASAAGQVAAAAAPIGLADRTPIVEPTGLAPWVALVGVLVALGAFALRRRTRPGGPAD